MKRILNLVLSLLIVSITLNAQVKISDTGDQTLNANSLLELESTNKGVLPPRVVINDLTQVSPLTGTTPAGMLVYSSGGGVTDGYYMWDGTKWKPFATGVGSVNVVAKTANATLLKTETFVAASNDIVLTLPVVTAADNGLAITIKNAGTYTDLVQVEGNGSATIDGIDTAKLTRWKGNTFIAYDGNWLRKEKDNGTEAIYDVGPSGSWTSIPEILAFLENHMTAPSTVRLDGGAYELAETQVVDLEFPVTIEGPSYGQATIAPAEGFAQGTPLFSCVSEVSFKMIAFDATNVTGYGTHADEDALQLVTAEQYHEIKDCTFDRFYVAIHLMNNVDIWLFESDISNAVAAGVQVAAGTSKYVSFFTSESDFTDCAKAINLSSGDSATVSVQNCTFTCSTGQTGLNYDPGTFTNTVSLFFTNNTWNNIGTFLSGFDFTRSDGRDANVEIINNAGIGDKTPHCRINVTNNGSTTTVTTAGTYYKANWTNTSTITVNWAIDGNKITYLPSNRKDVVFHISGNVSVNSQNESVTVGIVKNGVTGTRYGETTLRTNTQNQAYPFSTVIYLQDVAEGDYFELYATTASDSKVLIFQDMNIYVTAQ